MKIEVVDTHTAGQPARIVVSGIGKLPGTDMRARRDAFRNRYDHLRTGLLAEPRGHAGMCGCVLVDPCSPGADFGALFMHNAGYVDVSGHGAMGVLTVLVESGIVAVEGGRSHVSLDTPAGIVRAEAEIEDFKMVGVTFYSVPAWVGLQAVSLRVPGCGEVVVDVAFGGNLFVQVWAEHLGLELNPSSMQAATEVATAVMQAAADKLVVREPLTGNRCEIAGVTLLDAPDAAPPALRIAHVHGPGIFDRSPGATAAAARLAVMLERGEILVHDEVVVESAVGEESFRAKVFERRPLGAHVAVSTEIRGRTFITGFHDFVFAEDDPLAAGFLVGGGVPPRR